MLKTPAALVLPYMRVLHTNPLADVPMNTSIKQHHSIAQLAKLWGYSETTVRSWFKDVPCLAIRHPEKMHTRGYKSIRVPQSVADRVYALHTS
jgi:hypothetical protein